MLPGQRPQLGRQGKGQQEIVNRHLFFELAFQPLLALVMLTMGAVAMPAGVRHKDLTVTGGALRLHAWAERGTAGFHSGQCPLMTRQDRLPVLRQKPGLKGFDDR